MVCLDNENMILSYISGRIRHNFFIHILSVDRVKFEESDYDSNGGHIIYHLSTLKQNGLMIRRFSQFCHSFRRDRTRNSKFQETYFLPIKRFRIKLRNDKYENKSLRS